MTLDPLGCKFFTICGTWKSSVCLLSKKEICSLESFATWKIFELCSNSWTWYGTDFPPLFFLLSNCLGTGLGGQVSSAPWRTYYKSFDSGFAFFQNSYFSVLASMKQNLVDFTDSMHQPHRGDPFMYRVYTVSQVVCSMVRYTEMDMV